MPERAFCLEVAHRMQQPWERRSFDANVIVVLRTEMLLQMTWLADSPFWAVLGEEAIGGFYVRRSSPTPRGGFSAILREDFIYLNMSEDSFPDPGKMPRKYTRFSLEAFREYLRVQRREAERKVWKN